MTNILVILISTCILLLITTILYERGSKYRRLYEDKCMEFDGAVRTAIASEAMREATETKFKEFQAIANQFAQRPNMAAITDDQIVKMSQLIAHGLTIHPKSTFN